MKPLIMFHESGSFWTDDPNWKHNIQNGYDFGELHADESITEFELKRYTKDIGFTRIRRADLIIFIENLSDADRAALAEAIQEAEDID